MTDTIRVTVEVPALSEAQIEALRLAFDRAPSITLHEQQFKCICSPSERWQLFEHGLLYRLEEGYRLAATRLGRAVLEHYEREAAAAAVCSQG